MTSFPTYRLVQCACYHVWDVVMSRINYDKEFARAFKKERGRAPGHCYCGKRLEP